MRQNPEMIEAFDPEKEEWRVIIETPKGSCNKYDYDTELGIFKLSQVLPEGLLFPFDFGFVPSTLGDDGDPLDVLLLMDQATFTGCLVPSRLIGVIEAEQTETDGTKERNDRLLAIPIHTRQFRKIRTINDLEKRVINEIERFFSTYNEESGKKFKVIDLHGRHRADSLVKTGLKQFEKQCRKTRKRDRKK
jgi:inorganic pyrophosphatase